MSRRKKFLFLVLPLFLAFFALCFLIGFRDRIQFYFLSRDLLKNELGDNTLSLHYSIAYPEKYGLSGKPQLPIYTSDSERNTLSYVKKLAHISRQNLSEPETDTYDLLKKRLNLELIGAEYTYYQEPFSPSSGVPSSLPILLADYSFRRKQDVEDYLSLLDQTDDYVSSLLLYEQQKAEAGLFMSEASARKIITQCPQIMDQKLLGKKEHFLQLTFQDRLTQLLADGLITQEEEADYIARNDKLLTEVLVPAYSQIADTFTLLLHSDTPKNPYGLAHLPDGRAYYEYLLLQTTGSSRSISEIKRLLYSDFQKNYDALLKLLAAHPELAGSTSSADSLSLPENPAEILSVLQSSMRQDFPAFPSEGTSFVPTVTVKAVPSSLENYTSPAYYLTPPVDDVLNNVIYINHRSDVEPLSLFTTLAHEGYPGHLYQTVYSHLYLNQQKAPLIRHFLHYGGFIEGYAYYVENLSYDYAPQYLRDYAENSVSSGVAYIEACRLNRNLHLCLYSLLDLAIHYDGANPDQVKQILKKAGVTSPASSEAIYQYIVEEPATYPKYYLGYLEILELKKQMQKAQGDAFDLKAFHRFLLENGPADFDTLRVKLDRAIASEQKQPKR